MNVEASQLKPTLVITRGLPGSGKTTWAKEWVSEEPGRVRVNRDDLRDMLHGTRTGLNHSQEVDVTRASRGAVREALKAGRDVVADDMNLRPRYVREWRTLAEECGVFFRVEEMPTDVDLAIERDSGRDTPLGPEIIRGLAQKFIRKDGYLPVLDEPVKPSPTWTPVEYRWGLEPAILVDIDGTVALMGNRNPFDESAVFEDQPNYPIIDLVCFFRDQGYAVIFMSGRTTRCREDTERWILFHEAGRGGDALHMRAVGDQRPDDVVKHELFDLHVRGKYNIHYVLDDRDSVVAMWRAMGLTCLQVAPGAF